MTTEKRLENIEKRLEGIERWIEGIDQWMEKNEQFQKFYAKTQECLKVAGEGYELANFAKGIAELANDKVTTAHAQAYNLAMASREERFQIEVGEEIAI